MTQQQNRTLLDLHSLALAGRLEEWEIKDEIQKAAIEMDRAFVMGEKDDDIKEFFSELQKLLEIFNMQE